MQIFSLQCAYAMLSRYGSVPVTNSLINQIFDLRLWLIARTHLDTNVDIGITNVPKKYSTYISVASQRSAQTVQDPQIGSR